MYGEPTITHYKDWKCAMNENSSLRIAAKVFILQGM